jgi:hypothetical protein
MASTYTSNTGIEKPGDGEQVGLWGDTANTNFDIIDRGLVGVGTITLSGTTHTLTTSDGLLSDGHYKVLIFSGSPSGTNTVTISPNDQSKAFWVYNSTSESVVLTQGSGGNATVPAGRSALVYANGGGSGAAVVDLSALFSFGVAAFGTSEASKVVTADASGDVSLVGNLSVKDVDEEALALSGTTPSLDVSAAQDFSLTTSGNTTVSVTNAPTGRAWVRTLTVTFGGAHTLAITSANWGDAGAPTAASGDVVVIQLFGVGTSFKAVVVWRDTA